MINTTTIPTHPNMLISFFTVGSVLLLGILMGSAVIEIILHGIYLKDKKNKEEEQDSEAEEQDSEAEHSEAEQAAEQTYCNKYADAFEALSLRELSEEELQNLNQYIVREQVSEKLEVILTFDKATETFWYYTDHLKEVSYAILETVAQKYAIEYDCKVILQEPEDISAQEPVDSAEPSLIGSTVFAKFKKYNAGKGAVSNFTSVIKVIEQMNHFRYRGKIHDYEETLKQEEKKEVLMDYVTYKKLLEEKKEI
jgi:hypothetical protein